MEKKNGQDFQSLDVHHFVLGFHVEFHMGEPEQ